MKHHPASVDLELIKRLAATTRAKTLLQFLCRDFSCISKDFAGAVLLPKHTYEKDRYPLQVQRQQQMWECLAFSLKREAVPAAHREE